MAGPAVGLPRYVRGTALSAACLLLSLAAHAAAGGHVRLGVGLWTAVLLLSAFCVLAANRRATPYEIGAVVAVSQVLLHVFAGLGGHPTHSVDPATPGMWAAHLTAGTLMTVLLAQGERLVWVLFALFERLVRLAIVWPVPARPRTLAVPHRVPDVPRIRVVAEPVGERGPPLVCPASR